MYICSRMKNIETLDVEKLYFNYLKTIQFMSQLVLTYREYFLNTSITNVISTDRAELMFKFA